jgi:hypothetical protein
MPFDINGEVLTNLEIKTFNENNIVRNGLVLHLDAGNSVSYPGTGTTWTDLSGNGNNGILTNGPVFNIENGGTIVFDGSNDYVTIPYSSNWNFGTGEFALDIWVNVTSLSPFYQGMLGTFPSKWPASNWLVMTSTSSNAIRLYTFDGTTEGGVSNPGVVNGWMHGVITRVSNTVTLYVNGVAVDSSDFTGKAVNDSGNPLLIGNAGGTYANMKMAIVKIYKGVGLSASQVLQNYNANRRRFKI